MKLPKRFILISLVIFVLLFIASPVTNAQNQCGGWQFDPQVTEIGKNAERARQFVYWIFTHPPSYTVPVLQQIWSLSRNVVFAFFILVIAITGLGYVLARRSGNVGPIFSGISSPIFGITIPTLFFRIGMLLLYVTFSFVLVLGLIQSSEIFSRFFAEKYFGCDLFNIRFSGQGTSCEMTPQRLADMEKNYTEFVGCKDPSLLNQESANTGLFLVRLTTLTYNLFSVVLVLRHVILWFLLMISPFLAILMPFIFIRNTGYIWIGVFLQWLFYGPMVSLFLSGLILIWKSGIPFAFDFTRRNQADGQIFPTAINILYGGPAQVLSPTNSANYVDTYAEYIISLVMLWTAIFLPWLLLRIFRDYCCDILRQNQAALLSVLDKIRGVGAPPPPPAVGPIASTMTGMQLPFRKTTEELKKTSIKKLEDVSKANTYELTRSLSLSVGSLSEIARYEMDKRESSQVLSTLNRIANPYAISRDEDKRLFNQIKSELSLRADKGDRQAQQILSAALNKPSLVSTLPVSREMPEIGLKETINSLAKESSLSVEKIKEVLREIPQITVENQLSLLAQKTDLPQQSVQQVLNSLPQQTPKGLGLTTLLAENPYIASEISKRTGIMEDKVREVLNEFSQSTLSHAERLEKVAKDTTVSAEKIKEILEELPQIIVNSYPQIFESIAKNKDIISFVASQTSLSPEKVQQVLQTAATTVKTISEPGKETRQGIDLLKLANIVGVPTAQLETVLKMSAGRLPLNSPKLIAALTREPTVVAALKKQSGLPEDEIKNILDRISQISPLKSQFEDQVEMMAEVSGLTKDKVKDILGTVAAVNLEKPETTKPKVARHPTVSVEDYEEVKNMWTNHYKSSEVPVSEKIQNRQAWVNEDINNLTNMLNLLTSLNPVDKDKGMKQVAAILPFLLLGGFSDIETVVYLKAKLQAAKTVLSELEEREKIKAEVLKEEEETLLEVPAQEKKEELKTFEELEQAKELPNKEDTNKNK